MATNSPSKTIGRLAMAAAAAPEATAAMACSSSARSPPLLTSCVQLALAPCHTTKRTEAPRAPVRRSIYVCRQLLFRGRKQARRFGAAAFLQVLLLPVTCLDVPPRPTGHHRRALL